MPIFTKWHAAKNELKKWRYPTYWDMIALCLVLGTITLLALGAKGMATPYHLGEPIPISLDPVNLPYYAFRSVLRMGIAMIVSLLFTFIVGTAAAKSTHAERFIIPSIDILQSVPVLGYLSITVIAFIALFPNSLLGPEFAAIFVIFTAQVWNMTLSFYQSLKSVPTDLQEAARVLQLSAWQRFWRLDAPFAMPGLLWNVMMSMSGSWFFVVASEAITVNNQEITLPGIGSYIALAIQQADMHAIVYAIIAMFMVILLYDQMLFRPLNQWIDKFKFEQLSEEPTSSSWVITLFQHAKWLRHSGRFLVVIWNYFVNFPLFRLKPVAAPHKTEWKQSVSHFSVVLWYILLIAALVVALATLIHFVFSSVTLKEAGHVTWLGFVTAFRVTAMVLLSSIIWIPLGVWIGLRPSVARIAQPIIQFAASFPVNLFYPIMVFIIVTYGLNVDVWSSPLMILGAQWYIAFNVIAGVIALPKDLHQAAGSLDLKGWLWWKRFILPGIFPYYVTGAITAAGGAWNASIVAEVLNWGSTHLVATGLGAYVTQQSIIGDFPRLALGICIMCFYVLVFNKVLWRPLYRMATGRFSLN
ncbi:MAG: transporter permease protein [Gammaproteobacteria bacterium]|jgi:NitT/TauT family transport system permease protein|nr:transporter permease protein [Gammaproteobacteria bacterium]